MNTMNDIKGYNKMLFNNKTKISLENYFENVISKFYNDIDLEFVPYFLELCDHENQYYVHHNKLKEFGVLKTIKSDTIKNCLAGNLLVEGEDYRLHNIMQPVKQGGYSVKIDYILTPHAFKVCVIRSKNEKRYVKYFLLLERVLKYYQQYQREYNFRKELENILHKRIILLKEDTIKFKGDKIDELMRKLDEQDEKMNKIIFHSIKTEQIAERHREIAEIANDKIEDLKEDMHITIEKLDDANFKIDDMRDVVNDVANRSVPMSRDVNENSEFALLQEIIRPNRYYVIRSKNGRIQSVVANKLNTHNLITRTYNANAIRLYGEFRDETRRSDRELTLNIINGTANNEQKEIMINYIRADDILNNKMELINAINTDTPITRRRSIRDCYDRNKKITFIGNDIEIRNITQNDLLNIIQDAIDVKFDVLERIN